MNDSSHDGPKSRAGSILLLILGVISVMGLLAFAFSRLSLEAQADASRFVRREVCEQSLNAALDEAFQVMQSRGSLPGTAEFEWLTDPSHRQTPFAVPLSITNRELDFLGHDHPRLRPEEIKVEAVLTDFRDHDSKNRPYFPGEGVGVLSLSGRCRVRGETMVRTRTHDLKIASLLTPRQRDLQTTYAANRLLDFALFVRNGAAEMRQAATNSAAAKLLLIFPTVPPEQKLGDILLGSEQAVSEQARAAKPGTTIDLSPGNTDAIDTLPPSSSRFRNLQGGDVHDLTTAGDQGIQPFRHLNLAARRIAIENEESDQARAEQRTALEECGVFRAATGELRLNGIIFVQGAPLELTSPTGSLTVKGRGVLIADEIIINCGLKTDSAFPGGSLAVLCAKKGPITIRTTQPIEAALLAVSWYPGTVGRLIVEPKASLDLTGLIAVDELGLEGWPGGVTHQLIYDPRFSLPAANKSPLFMISLSHALNWQQTIREE